MAKLQFTPPTYATNNVEQLPDVVIGDATAIQNVFDKVGVDGKAYTVELLAELNGNDGANKIGLLNPNLAALSVADGIEEVRLVAIEAQAGEILPNSINNSKLVADIKIGSLALVGTTEKSSVIGAINEVNYNAILAQTAATSAQNLTSTVYTELNIARMAKVSTGSNVAYSVNTEGEFDLTRDGNRLMFIPNTTNTGSCTLTVDANSTKNTRKANDAGSYVALEAGDVKQGAPTEFVWSVANDFFILRPSGGSAIKSIQRGTISSSGTTENVTITGVNTSFSICKISSTIDNGSQSTLASTHFKAKFTSSTNLQLTRGGNAVVVPVSWEVIEFNPSAIKSIQELEVLLNAQPKNTTITSVDTSKTSVIDSGYSSTYVASTTIQATVSSYLTSSTNVRMDAQSSYLITQRVYVVEFK